MGNHVIEGIRTDQFIMLEKIARRCHVQWFPLVLHLVNDFMDQAFGAMRQQVIGCTSCVVGQGDDAAAQFYQLQQALVFSDNETPFEGIVGLFIQLSNIAHLLNLLENAFNVLKQIEQDDEQHSLQAVVAFLKTMELPQESSKYADMVKYVINGAENRFEGKYVEVAWRVPLFARMGQMLALDELFCQKFPVFVDRFVLTLFVKLEEWEKENVEGVMKAVVNILIFLLTVTRCESQFLDGGECMKVGEKEE